MLISEEWDYERAHLRVRRLVREVCQCAWCNATVTATPPVPTHPVCKAMQYAINHWQALTRFLHVPDVPIDNNIDNNDSERALRKVALLRNNSMFASAPEGSRRYCVPWTLIGTCRRIGIEPFAYPEWALTRVVPHPDNRDLRAADLTPNAYKARQQAAADGRAGARCWGCGYHAPPGTATGERRASELRGRLSARRVAGRAARCCSARRAASPSPQRPRWPKHPSPVDPPPATATAPSPAGLAADPAQRGAARRPWGWLRQVPPAPAAPAA